MPFNLAEFSKLQTDPIRKGVIQNLLRKGRILEFLPFENVNALENVAVQWTKLPGVAFRRINMGYTASNGAYRQVSEALYGFGGDIEFDRVFDKLTNTVVNPKVDQMLQKTTAMALNFNDYFINGDHASDPDGFEGLKKRISNMPSRQLVSASGSTDILDPTSSAANARKFLDKFEDAYDAAGGGSEEPSIICCNRGMKLGIGRVLRYLQIQGGNVLDVTKDQFGRKQFEYMGTPIIDMGLKADQSTEIIGNTEDPGDGGNDATSMYFVPFSIEQGITGMQLSDMEVYDPLDGGEQESKPVNMMRIDWWVGLAGFGSYGASRLYKIEKPSAWT